MDDPMWAQLKSNYENGADVVQLLSKARSGAPLDEWYDPLLQHLLHQYTLSQAAYAAVPHLVDIARERPDARLHLLVLVGLCYAHSSDDDAPELPSPLEGAWQSAQAQALPLLLKVLEDPDLDENETRYLLASLAALKGHKQLSMAIESSDVEIQ